MNLYQKYRPVKLALIQGNQKIKNIIESWGEDIPKSILLYGPSGCGKTTIARIISNILKINDPIEINSANNRGIETARNIEEISKSKAFFNNGKRLFIIDEAHQTSKDFQNSILKVLEDSEDWNHYILCTTDPEKLLVTIKNRCFQLKVETLAEDEIEEILKRIIKKEACEISNDAVKIICKKSDGSARQAIIMLEQVYKLSKDEQKENLNSLKTEEAQMIDLCRALLAKKKILEIIKILSLLKNSDPEHLRRLILKYFTTVILNSKTEGDFYRIAMIIEAFKESTWQSGYAGIISACVNITLNE